MGTTAGGLRFPDNADAVDVPGDIENLALDVDTTKATKATTITAGTGLTGGGDLSANRTLAVAFGTTAGTAAQGNDSRLSDQRVPTDGSVTIAKREEQYAAISTATTLGATQSVVDVTGTTTVTLPTAASHTGRVYTIRNTGTNTVTVSGITNLTLPAKGTVEVVSNGTAWSVLRGTYVDESVGRRVFDWNNSLATPGWQMTYGDTGWRDVSALVESGTTGLFLVRRINSTVHMRTINANNASGAMLVLPAGFRLANGGDGTSIALTTAVATAGAAAHNTTGTGSMTLTSGIKAYAGAWLEWSYITLNAWPSSLPGTASGAIPS